MVRLKCKKCGNVFEQGFSGAILAAHLGPYHYMKCPACGKNSWLNVYKSVKDPVTWSPESKPREALRQQLTEEELERRQIEDSKYERD